MIKTDEIFCWIDWLAFSVDLERALMIAYVDLHAGPVWRPTKAQLRDMGYPVT